MSKDNKLKKVVTFGVYDMLHIGHILLFKKAKELGNYLIVAVQDDETILKYKPEVQIVYTTTVRKMMVGAIRYVDEVVIYKDVDEDIKKIDFDIFAIGPDQTHDGFKKAIDWCNNNGKSVVTIPRTEGISSTILREIKR
ncbi:MAG: adenylyltransferase/cytidyltransferase family protein [Prevotella sp.]|nr:adenylyltransferase/cytidyltransferase family protein [Prevotella sp.]